MDVQDIMAVEEGRYASPALATTHRIEAPEQPQADELSDVLHEVALGEVLGSDVSAGSRGETDKSHDCGDWLCNAQSIAFTFSLLMLGMAIIEFCFGSSTKRLTVLVSLALALQFVVLLLFCVRVAVEPLEPDEAAAAVEGGAEDDANAHRSEKEVTILVAQRIQQLAERSRICTYSDWKEKYVPSMAWSADKSPCKCKHQQPQQCACPVCLVDFADEDRVRGLSCGHIYHVHCVAQWFLSDKSFELPCPLCRRSIAEQDPMQREVC
eukprot:TRINITY_DN18687_c0_g1_i1.p1 TRINITY_DN18687_c0_g1~~TRINITY_DN18687_c0_g1_i1.p1  ORF type:complete len:267 (+),score=34.70 TRINITY_DN18687_c0_g1_i1:123-923(+)